MLSRRELLWMSMAATYSGVLSRKGLRAKFPKAFWDDPSSPPTTPFIAPLPFPHPPLLTAPFRRRDRTCHEITQEEVLVPLHPDLPLTPVWRYRDKMIPAAQHADAFGLLQAGPTIVATTGSPMKVRMCNDLPDPHIGFGLNHTTTHYHGGHIEARSDGFPEKGNAPNPTFDPIVLPGEHRDYNFAFQDVGFSHGDPDPDQRPATQWYHDHLLDFTGANVQRGLAGFLLVFDELDTGDETTGLRLPSFWKPDGSTPAYDIPLAFQDRMIAPDGTLVYLPEDFDGFLGDKRMVNGRIDPFFEVEARKYRFRILMATNARMNQYNLIDENGQRFPFDIIGNGGGLYAGPIREQLTTGIISPGERKDIIVDFSQFPPGMKLYLEDVVEQEDGRGPGGDFEEPDLVPNGEGTRVLEFRVVPATGPDLSQVPDVLRPITAVPQSEIDAATRREVVFERGNGTWQINDEFVDLDNPIFTIPINTPEVWTLKNNGGGWWHPIHIHLELMRVLSRNGELPPMDERDGFAKKDTVNLGPNDEVEVFLKFRDFPGPWVFHCHNIEHEDHFMMARFDVV